MIETTAYSAGYPVTEPPILVEAPVVKEGLKMPDHINTIDELSSKYLNHLVAHPQEHIGKFHQVMFAAGGALVLEFGDRQSAVWQEMMARAQESGQATIAGVELTIPELELMGEFYRWLRDDKGIKLHCIDERLDEHEHPESQIHCQCGACQAVGEFIKAQTSVEDQLAANTSYVPAGSAKQPLLSGMYHHASRAIYLDLSTHCRAPKADKRWEMKENHALTFNVSLPVEFVAEFCQEKFPAQVEAKIKLLLSTLVKWNVQIAKNIIASHNEFSKLKDHTLLLIDKRDQGDSENPYLAAMLSQVVPQEYQRSIK